MIGPTTEELAALNAEASRRMGGQHRANPRLPTGIEGVIAALHERTATGQPPPPAASGHLDRAPRRNRGKLHAADIPEFLPAPEAGPYHAKLAEVLLKRQKGNPLAPQIAEVARAVYYGMSTGNRQTLKQIAKRSKCCVETARKCIIFLEAQGLFGVLNVLVRVGADLVRGANLYLSVDLIDPASGAMRRVSRRFSGVLTTFIEKAAAKLHLAARPLGLNTAPLRLPGAT